MFRDGKAPAVDVVPMSFGSLGTPATRNVNPFLRAYQEDFAARAQWCAHRPETCSHPARIEGVTADRAAIAGERIELTAQVLDPDGAGFDASWIVSPHSGSYNGTVDLAEWQASELDAIFTVPNDAQTGDRFVLTLSVRTSANRPCTRYAQVAVAVR